MNRRVHDEPLTHEDHMQEHDTGAVVAAGDIFPPALPASRDTKAGSTEDLKALHAELTATYREYLDMAKVKPSLLNPAMLGLIQQFLRHNAVTAEAPKQAELDALQKRLAQKRKTREASMARQGMTLRQSKKD